MKILHIIDSLRIGGKEKQLILLLQKLSVEHKVILLTFNDKIEFPQINNMDVKLIVYKNNRKSPGYFSFLGKLIRDEEIEIVHTWEAVSALIAGIFLKFKGIPHINGSIRGSAPLSVINGKRKVIMKLSYLLADMVIANSKAGLLASGNSPGKKYRYIHNGYGPKNDSPPNPEKVRKEFSINDKMVVGMVSNFRGGKDYDIFIKVATKITKERDDVVFMAVGKGKDFDRHEQSVAEELKNKVILTGQRNDVDDLVSMFDIGVLLSYFCRNHGEGISNSIMEYMAHAKPVITTNSGGNPEIVHHGENGLVITPRSEEEFYDAVIELLDDPEKRKIFGEKGREILDEDFSVDVMYNRYLEIYKSFVNKK